VTVLADIKLVVLVGHPRPRSRTHAVAVRTGDLLHRGLVDERVAVSPPGLVDLAELAPHLPAGTGDGRADAALRAVGGADLLVVASPTFRTAYTGLLKLFLDLLPRDGLEGTTVVPVTTAGIAAQRLATDQALRPVLRALRAQLPTAGINLLEDELTDIDERFTTWWREQGARLARTLDGRADSGEGVGHVGRSRAVAG
jgi:FMN reductase